MTKKMTTVYRVYDKGNGKLIATVWNEEDAKKVVNRAKTRERIIKTETFEETIYETPNEYWAEYYDRMNWNLKVWEDDAKRWWAERL